MTHPCPKNSEQNREKKEILYIIFNAQILSNTKSIMDRARQQLKLSLQFRIYY